MSAISSAKGSFRILLKSAKFAFKSDVFAYKAARAQLRTEFLKNKDEKNPDNLKRMFAEADEIAEFLKFNLVQGTRNDRGNFDVSLSEENMVVVEAGQANPHGPELAPVDTSVLGQTVIIDKVNKPSKCKSTEK